MAVAAMIGLCSCNKSKDCKCTHTRNIPGETEPMVTETTLTIEKGKCSDNDASQTTTFDGDTITQVIKCVEI